MSNPKRSNVILACILTASAVSLLLVLAIFAASFASDNAFAAGPPTVNGLF
jgi:hypothetical protein